MELQEVGAYVALLSVAWQSDPHGVLPDDEDRLRRWARMSRDQWSESRALLLSKFPVVELGYRANARMVEEASKQAVFAEAQRRKAVKRWGSPGGHPGQCRDDAPALISDAGGMPSVSVSVSASKNRKAHTSASPSGAADGGCEPFPAAWNELCGALAKVHKVTKSRAAKVRLRMSEGLDIESFRTAVKACATTPFLRGDGGRGFRASFDWLMDNDKNLTKVLEGQYGSPLAESGRSYRAEDYDSGD